ncbi:hypothetical protein [Flavobacterium johnsoniae]|uniref:Uncharacterized protein n=1 Tax=Flavobacterium johnsoniae (strain ATCC 17061 / DSM 2064 / JCM 8514 / BCRC 14874 / CCUG 350202 / NBRC 14942 / NCIMB 11054 / UW101) TaxID=376686 RepID=A5FDX2_FLAJ1|nr:hypothetical protein [Flavobacterium johnsoniae]ABQ06603.1 hypothetical protein Fjoh_3589 [Flavobacterium johnsoniae UW101]OXE99840.1 hypothetical protein B0A63_11095 [Flavobacterium johnsoniae UW101]WQG82355.1 hypothetical protein SR927_04390 [Flavobacterium johnsoniae UW101]SHK81003.1 hypothetical protein SAMN05444146_2343 [Flavobacterium johnsoniae]
MNSINPTTLIAIYGALISTVLLAYRYMERKELKRNLYVDISSRVKRNANNQLINERRGGWFLVVTITNSAKTSTYIDRYFFKSYNHRLIPSQFCGFDFKHGIINSDKDFPIKLEHGEKFTIEYPLSNNQGIDGNENMENIRKMSKTCKYMEAYCSDTLEKWHHGRPFNIEMFCKHFDLVEENLR